MSDIRTVAVVGVGRAGLQHARAAAKEGLRVTAFSSLTALSERASAFAAEFPQARRIDIDDPELCNSAQLIVVALPPGVTHEIVPRLARDSRQLLVEKPLALSTSRVETIAHTSAASGCVVTAGYNRRVYPTVDLARKILSTDPPRNVVVTIVEDLDFILKTKGPEFQSHYLRHGSSSHMLDLSSHLFGEQKIIDVQVTASKLNSWFMEYQFRSRGESGLEILTTIDARDRARRGFRIVLTSGRQLEIAPLERLRMPVSDLAPVGLEGMTEGTSYFPASYQESFSAQMRLVARGEVEQLHSIDDALRLSKLIDELEVASLGLRHA